MARSTSRLWTIVIDRFPPEKTTPGVVAAGQSNFHHRQGKPWIFIPSNPCYLAHVPRWLLSPSPNLHVHSRRVIVEPSLPAWPPAEFKLMRRGGRVIAVGALESGSNALLGWTPLDILSLPLFMPPYISRMNGLARGDYRVGQLSAGFAINRPANCWFFELVVLSVRTLDKGDVGWISYRFEERFEEIFLRLIYR